MIELRWVVRPMQTPSVLNEEGLWVQQTVRVLQYRENNMKSVFENIKPIWTDVPVVEGEK